MRPLPLPLARTRALALALALVTAGGPAAALAQTPCLDDVARLCAGIPAEGGQVWACLKRNETQLSSACVQNIREVQRRANEFAADCAGDVFRFCPAVPRGGGRVLDCLRVHVGRRELSSNCDEAVATALEKIQEFAEACYADANALCPGVASGGGRLFLCLRAQHEKLSSRCKRAVSP